MNIKGLIDCLYMAWFIDTFLRLHNINLLIAPFIGVQQRNPQIEEKKNQKPNNTQPTNQPKINTPPPPKPVEGEDVVFFFFCIVQLCVETCT